MKKKKKRRQNLKDKKNKKKEKANFRSNDYLINPNKKKY